MEIKCPHFAEGRIVPDRNILDFGLSPYNKWHELSLGDQRVRLLVNETGVTIDFEFGKTVWIPMNQVEDIIRIFKETMIIT